MDTLNATAISAMAAALTPEQIAQAQWAIANYGRITTHDFKVSSPRYSEKSESLKQMQVVLGVLFGFAILSLFGRISIRLILRRRLFLDDGFLIFGFICLVGGTAILYKRIYMIYLEFSVLSGNPTASLLAFKQTNEFLEESKWDVAYPLFLWTAIFAVKWCYFAFFYRLLRAMWKGIVYFYRFAIILSIVSWLFLVVGEQLITCPYVGKAACMIPAFGEALRFIPLNIMLSEVLPKTTSIQAGASCFVLVRTSP